MPSLSAAASYVHGFSQCGGFLCAEPWFFILSSEADVCQHHRPLFLKTYVAASFRVSAALFCVTCQSELHLVVSPE